MMRVAWSLCLLMAGLIISPGACAQALTRAGAGAGLGAAPDTHGAAQQILVMVHDQPLRHFRPDDAYGPGYGPAAVLVSPPPSARAARTIRSINRDFRLTPVSDWPMPALGVHCFVETPAVGESVETLVQRLAQDARVESAEPLRNYRTLAAGGAAASEVGSAVGGPALHRADPYYDLQSSARLLDLDALHRMATGRHVRVAQIDSGVEAEHPDLAGQVVDAPNFVSNDAAPAEAHGTEVAGIIAARAGNQVGIVGVAPDARLLSLRACWQAADDADAALCSNFTLAKALQYAIARRVQVLNMSLAGPPDRLLTRLINEAVSRGMTVVAAVDPRAAPGLGFPAGLPNVVAVAGLGSHLGGGALAAPSERVLTTTPHASWGFVSGSSFGAAHVSGLVALMLEVAPGLEPTTVLRLLHQHAHPLAAPSAGSTPLVQACEVLASQLHGNRAEGHLCSCCAAPAAGS